MPRPRTGCSSAIMAYIVATAPIVQVHRAIAQDGRVEVVATPQAGTTIEGVTVPDYEDSPHASVIERLWDVKDPSLLELVDEDGNGSGDVRVWIATDDTSEPAESRGEGSYEAWDALHIDSEVLPFVTETDPILFGALTTDTYVVAGEVTNGTTDPLPLVALHQVRTVEYFNLDADAVVVQSLTVMSSPDTIDAALEEVDGLREAEPFKAYDHKYTCYLPDWVGSDGESCCGVWAAYNARVRACHYEYKAILTGCLGAGSVVTGACVKFCWGVLVANPPLGQLCMIGCLVVAVVALVGCLSIAENLTAACLARECGDYLDRLDKRGCDVERPCRE